jgi:hypothetical protein
MATIQLGRHLAQALELGAAQALAFRFQGNAQGHRRFRRPESFASRFSIDNGLYQY